MDASAALQVCASNIPQDLQHYISEFYALHEQRLWHELTEKVQRFYAEPGAKAALYPLYKQFIGPWHKKMNPLVYAKISVETARQLRTPMISSAGATDALAINEALALLEEAVKEAKQVAGAQGAALVVYTTMEAAHYRLRNGDLAGTKRAIETCAENAESLAGVDPVITASYYRVCADYAKAMTSFSEFYRHALLYLASVKWEEIPAAEAQERAHDLCIAALLGENIYNFGELLAHPIVETLVDTPCGYLKGLLLAFNAGDHALFDKLLPSVLQHPSLKGEEEKLRHKLCLTSLVEALFRQLKTGRLISFAAISQSTRVLEDQVEFLLMRALSLNLARGTIHEPRRVFCIEWVQPRVLDSNQIAELRIGIQTWRQRVVETSKLINALLPSHVASLAS